MPDEVTGFCNWPSPSSHTMALGSIQPLTEMSTRNIPWGGGAVHMADEESGGDKGQPVRKADNLTIICEPTA
jgi:hypothetical protein